MELMQGFITIFVALITALLGPLIVELAKSKFNKKPKDILGESININEKIDHQLELIVEELKCDRISIIQFHNGGNFYPTGKSIKKFSIFYEKTAENITSIRDTFQNIPVSLFPKMFSILYKEGEIAIPKCSINSIDCGLFQIHGKQYKTKSFYVVAIKDLNNNFIGTLTISFYEKEHKFSLDEWIMLRQKVGAIGTILTDYLHDKK